MLDGPLVLAQGCVGRSNAGMRISLSPLGVLFLQLFQLFQLLLTVLDSPMVIAQFGAGDSFTLVRTGIRIMLVESMFLYGQQLLKAVPRLSVLSQLVLCFACELKGLSSKVGILGFLCAIQQLEADFFRVLVIFLVEMFLCGSGQLLFPEERGPEAPAAID